MRDSVTLTLLRLVFVWLAMVAVFTLGLIDPGLPTPEAAMVGLGAYLGLRWVSWAEDAIVW